MKYVLMSWNPPQLSGAACHQHHQHYHQHHHQSLPALYCASGAAAAAHAHGVHRLQLRAQQEHIVELQKQLAIFSDENK